MTTIKDFSLLNQDAPVVVIGGVNSSNEPHVLSIDTEGRLRVQSTATYTPAKLHVPIRIVRDYSVNSLGSSWTEIVPNTGAGWIFSVHIFDSSGEVVELGVGAVGAETAVALVPPGGIDLELAIAPSSRIVARSFSGATINTGMLILQLTKEVT